MRRVVAEQGFTSLWRGNTLAIVGKIPSPMLNFMFKDFFKGFNKVDRRAQPGKFMLANIATGAAAGASSLCFIYPLTILKLKAMTDVGRGATREYKGVFNCSKTISAHDGFFGFYKGFGISIFGIAAYRGLYFGLFDTGKALLGDSKNVFAMWAMAQTVTITAGLATYPIDTIRCRLAMMSGRDPEDRVYTRYADCVRKILKEEGLRGFYKGVVIRLVSGTGGAVLLVLYDKISSHSNKQ